MNNHRHYWANGVMICEKSKDNKVYAQTTADDCDYKDEFDTKDPLRLFRKHVKKYVKAKI